MAPPPVFWTVSHMKRAALALSAALLLPALTASAIVWWSSRPDGYRNDQVTVNEVVFGLDKIRTPLLDERGIDCRPKPEWSTSSNEEWPDNGAAPDPSHRASLPVLQQELFDCILNCLPADSTLWDGPPLSSSRPCFEERIPELSVKVGIVETFGAVGAMLETYPKLTFFCHEAGHKAGAAAVEAGVDLSIAIPAVGDYCVHGAVHGLLDAFAFSKPTLEDFDYIADICQSLPGGAGGGCTDGMGHASWDAYEDFAMTSQACGTIENLQLRYACDEGVLMRRYERGGRMTGTSTIEYKEFTARLRQDCTDWEKLSKRTEEPGGPGAGCWAAVQYMLWEPLSFLSRAYPDERWRGVENFDELIEEVLYTCKSFGPAGEDLCRGRDGYHVATVVNYKAEEFETVCRKLGDRVETCIKMANELLVSNSNR